jgi:hypothetical protein
MDDVVLAEQALVHRVHVVDSVTYRSASSAVMWSKSNASKGAVLQGTSRAC